jgi:hypothetical protein
MAGATRSPDQWREILAPLAADPKDVAARIFGDITHYQSGRTYYEDDCEQLANALAAWASLKGGA